MHDPGGRIEFDQTSVVRHHYVPLPDTHFLRTANARHLVDTGALVNFKIADDSTTVSPRIPFVTYPGEWTNAQLLDAGRLTLAISDQILPAGFELKDASAWNVLFDGTQPIFCDHLSFQPVALSQWRAFGQFVRHFLLPLCLTRIKNIDARTAFLLNQDGLAPDQARALFGVGRFFTRYWPLMLARSDSTAKLQNNDRKASELRGYHRNLYALSGWLLESLSQRSTSQSHWVRYADERKHYNSEASNVKRATVANWLTELAPAWVADAGCNTGEFTLLAHAAGACVIAIDQDHDSIQSLYISHRSNRRIFPVVASLADLSGGRGWCGKEFPGLLTRMEQLADMVMMLALIHHLAISHAVPYEEIADLAKVLTKRYLVLEFIGENDALVAHLCAQRQRRPEEFSLDRQRAAFSKQFRIVKEVRLPGTCRSVALLERHQR